MRPAFSIQQLLASLALLCCAAPCAAQAGAADTCARPAPGSAVEEPPEVRSRAGALEVELTLRRQRLPDGSERYCYLTPDGRQSPTLRVHPGDEVIVRLRNGLGSADAVKPTAAGASACALRPMTAFSTNLHFHGLALPALCHEDDVVRTVVEPGDPPFEYRFRIAPGEPPGLYWYHAHAHGLSALQVGGGASGALVVERGGEALPAVARGLRQRVLVIRDQALLHPDAPPAQTEPAISPTRRDRDGDAGNSGTGYGKPARDLSVNYVPVPYPSYPPATLTMRPNEREFWRVLNASSVTYLNLALLVNGVAQKLEVTAVDGVPVDWGHPGAAPTHTADHLGIAPGARMEFVVQAPAAGVVAQWVTRAVDTGPDGENDPKRALLDVVARADAPGQAPSEAPAPAKAQPAPPAPAWIGDTRPARTRRFYFWETPFDPAHPDKPAQFFITEEGHPMRVFDPAAEQPDVTVHQGDVEDWIIENRTRELHVFHIHQLHFQVREWFGIRLDEPFVRDTVNVPFYDYQMGHFPSVTLRMDFRDPSTIGTFVFHCHLLDHEDGGMMGTIRVEPPATAATAAAAAWRDARQWARGALERAGLLARPAPIRAAAFFTLCRSGTIIRDADAGARRARNEFARPARADPPASAAARAGLAADFGLIAGAAPALASANAASAHAHGK